MATIEVATPCNAAMYNALPSLHDVKALFDLKGGESLIHAIFEPLIREYKLEKIVGVGLLHRHFDLYDNEMLVEFNDISTPWLATECNTSSTSSSAGGSVVPNGFYVSRGNLVPYEFAFIPMSREREIDLDAPILLEFAGKFVRRIQDHGLENVVALRVLQNPDVDGLLEMTKGRANINLKTGQYSQELYSKASIAQWYFGAEGKTFRCACLPYSGHMHFQTR